MILLEKLTQIRRSEMSENGAKIFIYNNHKIKFIGKSSDISPKISVFVFFTKLRYFIQHFNFY